MPPCDMEKSSTRKSDTVARLFGVELPAALRGRIEGYGVQRHPYDESGASIFVLKKDGETLFLKARLGGDRLEMEHGVLAWIGGRLPVPEPVYYGREGSAEFLLTTRIPGTPVYLMPPERREGAVRVLSEALKRIHFLDPSGCPYTYTVESKVETVERGHGNDHRGWLRRGMPAEEQVFTHGDYCLPNVLVDEGGLGGVIDWDYGGLADPYVDFASCIGSLKYNFGAEEVEQLWAPLFFDEYGVDVDMRRLDHYQRLNRLLD